jgi:hypothetical protein
MAEDTAPKTPRWRNTSRPSADEAGRGTTRRFTPRASKPDEKFAGVNEKLKNNIFDYGGPGNQDGYSRTMKAVINLIGQDFDYPRDIQTTIETMSLYVVPLPDEPSGYGTDTVNKTESLIYEKKNQSLHPPRREATR